MAPLKPKIVMKLSSMFLSFLLLSGCSDQKSRPSNEVEASSPRIEKSVFQAILDSAGVQGAILVYDLKEDTYYSNDYDWAEKERLPASTFKIPNSIIALETGVVENDSSLFKWNGENRGLKIWEQDLIFKQAFQYSCVPCYQEVARKVGVDRMKAYLGKLDYKTMKFDSTTIDNFWLTGESRISQFQQIDFLKRFYQSQLPISNRNETLMKKIMVLDKEEDYTLSGKTGWSIRDGHNNGWFVGYVERGERTYFFATNIDPREEFDMKKFPMIRKEVTDKALRKMKIIK